MPSPDITSGTTERNKALRIPHRVVWRLERVFNQGETLFTPVFDVVTDGYPVNLGVSAVIPVPSSRFNITVALAGVASNNPGGQFRVLVVNDNGSFDASGIYKYYIQPRHAGGCTFIRYEAVSRRCRFSILNGLFGAVVGIIQGYNVEISVET